MEYNNFKKSVLELLVNYKKDVLKIEEEGTYRGTKYPHILPINDSDKNIINVCKSLKLQKLLEAKKKHQYFHHLNSSQALCLNLFGPILRKNVLQEVFDEFAIENCNPNITGFEKQSKDKSEFDFFIAGKNKNHENIDISFELKYTEQPVGGIKKSIN